MKVSTEPPSDQARPPAELEYHPAAALFPLLPVDSQEFGEVVEDIREHGLIQPIVLHEGKVLDGRNRLRACQHAGIEPRFVEWDGESPTAYVLPVVVGRAPVASLTGRLVEPECRLRPAGSVSTCSAACS